MQPTHTDPGETNRIGQICALLTMLVGIGGLLLPERGAPAGRQPEMNLPGVTSAAFILLGISLLLHSTWPRVRAGVYASRLCALTVALAGVWNLAISLVAFDPLAALLPGLATPAWLRVGGEPPAQATLMVLASLAICLATTNPSVWKLAHDLEISTATALLVTNLIVIIGILSMRSAGGSGWLPPVTLPAAAAYYSLALGLLIRTDVYLRPASGYLPTVWMLVVGILFSIYLFVTVDRFERSQVVVAFDQRARGLTSAVARSVDSDLAQIDYLSSFFAASESVTRASFSKFITPVLGGHPGIKALSWNRVVQDADRSQFEQAVQAEGWADFQLVEPDRFGRMQPAPQRPEYVVTYFVAPLAGNEDSLGYNLASEPLRWSALETARDTGLQAATAPIPLAPYWKRDLGLMVFQPVYRRGVSILTQQSRQENLVGYLGGVFNLQAMIGTSLQGLEQGGLTLNIYDSTDEANPVRIFSNNNIEKVADNELYWVDTIQVANRQWALECYSNVPLSSSQRSWQAWSVLVVGILLTTLAGTYLLTARRRTNEIREVQEALRDSSLHLQAVVQSANDAIVSANEKGEIVSWNRGAERVFGYSAPEMLGKPLTRLIPARYLEIYRVDMDWVAAVDHVPMMGNTFELDAVRKNGQEFPLEFTFSTYHIRGGVYISAILRDISERKEAESKLRYLSTHDTLTGLFNRAFFEAEIERLEHGRLFPISVIVADLDDFKLINDSYGHEAGDRALRSAGEVLRMPFRSEDLVARIGGDEFAVLLPNTDSEIAGQILPRIRQELERHNAVEGSIPIQISLGVCTTQPGDTIASVFHQADLRMYQDKACNKLKNRQN